MERNCWIPPHSGVLTDRTSPSVEPTRTRCVGGVRGAETGCAPQMDGNIGPALSCENSEGTDTGWRQ